jgi:ferrous iron transport protein A
MLLKDMQPGQSGKIIRIDKGHGAERRLFEIGLIPGVNVELLSRHPFKGPLLLQVGDARVAVGQGVAGYIQVELI